MPVSHRVESNVCIVSIEGNITLDMGLKEVNSYMKTLIKDESCKGFVINFEFVNFIDSSGIGMVVGIFKALQGRQAKLAICQLSEENKEIFTMTQLDSLINIYPTEEEALAGLIFEYGELTEKIMTLLFRRWLHVEFTPMVYSIPVIRIRKKI